MACVAIFAASHRGRDDVSGPELGMAADGSNLSMGKRKMAEAEAHCCEQMRDRLADGETAIWYLPKYREYGIPALDGGGNSMIVIRFYPWCGVRLPKSLRRQWFDRLDQLGLEPNDPNVPAAMLTDAWWKQNES